MNAAQPDVTTRADLRMKIARLTNYVAFAGMVAAHLFAGFFVLTLAKVYKEVYAEQGDPLPSFTHVVMAYVSAVNPITVAVIVALVCCALLVLAERAERTRPYLPFLTSCAWSLAVMHLAFAAIAFALPFIHMQTSAQQ